MLSDFTPVPTLAVSDLERARSFYEGVLGFTGEAEEDGVRFAAGPSKFFVYPSAYAGTNRATAMSLELDDGAAFDTEVAALRDKGVEFQTFDYEGITWDDGVATMGHLRSVWFSDPDGNIISVAARTA